jgi:hypothetical protein
MYAIDSPHCFRFPVFVLVVVGLLAGAAPRVLLEHRPAPPAPARLAAALAERPLALEARGDGFLVRSDGYDALLRPTGQLVALRGPLQLERNPLGRLLPQRTPPRQAGFTVRFLGARGDATAQTRSPLAPVRYVRRGTARTAPTFARVTYRGVYPGIDLAYHGKDVRLQGDWLVAPGADPARIRLAFDGVDALRRLRDGGIALTARGLHAKLTKPVAYQIADGRRRAVPASWLLRSRTLTFALGLYDQAIPLVIDPKLEGTLAVGGNDVDTFLDVDADPAGNIVAVGATVESQFPRVGNGAFRPGGGLDGVIVTVSPSLQILSTSVIGGLGEDFFQRVVAVAPGEWIVSAATTSMDFPITHALDSTYAPGTCGEGPCFDALLLAFSGGALRFSTYIGGARDDGITSLAFDRSARGGNGLLVFGGFSNSVEFVRAAGYDDVVGIVQYEAVERLALGTSFRVQLFGGAGNDSVNAVAVRGDNVYAAGGGRSTSQVTPGTFLGAENAFLMYSRDAGSTWQERAYASPGAYSEIDTVAVDADGSVYAGFAGFFPGGDYGTCRLGDCQPAGFVKLSAPDFAPGSVITLVPPRGQRYTVQDVAALRAQNGAIEALGAAVDIYASYSPAAVPTGFGVLLRPGPAIDSTVELPEGTHVWGSTFAGDALFLGGAALEEALPGVRGEADAFVTKIGDLGLAACRCVSITTAADHVKTSRRDVTFTLNWAMSCTGGAGQCQGGLAVQPPPGATMTQPTHDVRCGPRSCSTAAQKGSFRVRAASEAAARAGKHYTFRVKEWCIIAGARKTLPTRRITVAFKKNGALDRAASDLNGDGRSDGRG